MPRIAKKSSPKSKIEHEVALVVSRSAGGAQRRDHLCSNCGDPLDQDAVPNLDGSRWCTTCEEAYDDGCDCSEFSAHTCDFHARTA